MKVNKTYLSQLQTQTGNGQNMGQAQIKAQTPRPNGDQKVFKEILRDCLTK